MVSNGSGTPSENLEGIVPDKEFSPRDWLRRAQEERRNHTITFANIPDSLPTSSSSGVTFNSATSDTITATAISRSDKPANSGDTHVNNDASASNGGGACVGSNAPHTPFPADTPFTSELNQVDTKQDRRSLSTSSTPATTVFSGDEKGAREKETPSFLRGKMWGFIWAPELKVFRYILFAYLALKVIPFIFTVITSLLFQLAGSVGGAEVSCYTYNGIHYCDNENPKAIVEKIDSLKN